MKIQYTLFGIKTTHEFPGYAVLVQSSDNSVDRQVVHSHEVCKTYLGAIFIGWRLARLYAELDGKDTHYFIYRGTEAMYWDEPIRSRTIPVTTYRKVAFFSK